MSQITSEMERALIDIGFSEKESLVYLALLALGRSSAYTIGKRAQVKQSTAYFILEELITRGAVVRVPREKKQFFIAKPPEEILERASSSVEKLNRFLPELTNLFLSNQKEGSRTRTLFYEGIEGVTTAMWYRLQELESKTIKAFYGSAQYAHPTFIQLSQKWNKTLVKQSTKTLAVVPDHPSLKKYRELDRLQNRIVKSVPNEAYSADMSIEATDFFVRIILFKDLQAVIIDNGAVAKTVGQIFDLVWQTLPESSQIKAN